MQTKAHYLNITDKYQIQDGISAFSNAELFAQELMGFAVKRIRHWTKSDIPKKDIFKL